MGSGLFWVTLKKPMRCPAADDTEPALVFTMRSRMTDYYIGIVAKDDEMISSLGKVTIRPREERIKDMNVKGRPFWVEVPTFNLKSKPQSLGQVNHR